MVCSCDYKVTIINLCPKHPKDAKGRPITQAETWNHEFLGPKSPLFYQQLQNQRIRVGRIVMQQFSEDEWISAWAGRLPVEMPRRAKQLG